MDFGSLAQLQSTFSSAAMGMINSGWVWLVSDENGHMEIVGTFGAGTLLVRSRKHMLTDEKSPILGEPLTSRYKGPLTRVPENGTSPSAPGPSTPPSRASPPASHDHPSATSPTSGLHKSAPGLSPSTPSRALHASPLASQSDIAPNIYAKPPKTVTSQASTSPVPDFDGMGDILTPLLCVSVQEHAWVGAGYGVWGKEEYLKRFWTVVNWERVGKAFDKARTYR
jgi:Fe-Mn family superoxide dismutase